MLNGLLDHSVPEKSVHEIQGIQNYVFVDAREKEEFEVSHLQGAIHVGYDYFSDTALQNISKDDSVIVYCSVGYRSEKIAEKMQKMGFSHVYNLYGGIFEWKNQGRSVVNEMGKTNKVHAYSKTWGVWLRQGEKVYSPD